MTIETLYEEIRTRLREAQEDTVSEPWVYTDEALLYSVRSAIRHLRALGIDLLFDLDETGTFDSDPTEAQGVLIALKVTADLLRGDLLDKLNNGELGVSYRSVLDSYDSKTAATGLAQSLRSFEMDFKIILTKMLAGEIDEAVGVFGIPELAYTEE